MQGSNKYGSITHSAIHAVSVTFNFPDQFLDELRRFMRRRRLAANAQYSYFHWIKRYADYLRRHNLDEQCDSQAGPFLNYIAKQGQISHRVQGRAIDALKFLYDEFLQRPLLLPQSQLPEFPQPTIPVLSQLEVSRLFRHLHSEYLLCAELIYGTGLRVSECLRLRVRDVDCQQGQLLIRGSGARDSDDHKPNDNERGKGVRRVAVPLSLIDKFQQQLAYVTALHRRDCRKGYAAVNVPYAIARQNPAAKQALEWQYLFAAREYTFDPRSGKRRRHHLTVSTLQQQIQSASRVAGIGRRINSHTLRHSYALRLLEKGYCLDTVQALLGQTDNRTTDIYLQMIQRSADSNCVDVKPVGVDHAKVNHAEINHAEINHAGEPGEE